MEKICRFINNFKRNDKIQFKLVKSFIYEYFDADCISQLSETFDQLINLFKAK